MLGTLTPAAKLLFAIAMAFSCFIIFFFTALLVALPVFGLSMENIFSLLSKPEDPKALPLLEYFQVTQSVGLFIAPALLCGFLFGGSSGDYLKWKNGGTFPVYFIVFLMMFLSLPFINGLVNMNEMMKLPTWLKGMEDWMKSSEEQAARLTESFLAGKSFSQFLFNIFMIAILPALGEEFMFRGLLQRLFGDITKNVHIAIFITAFLFGAMHMQFYGILPRMVLGIIFGYLFYWSGSIWVPVFAHFVNNSGAVVISYLSNLGLISQKYQDFGSTDNPYLVTLSLLMTCACLWMVFRRKPL